MKKILIADDHSEIRELLKDILLDTDFELIVTESGSKAVLIAKRKQPDIIILDIMMPGRINGIDATKIIKSTPESINSKIIILSGKGSEKNKIEAIKAGASAFIEKPFSPIRLLDKIESLLSSTIH